MIRFVIGNSKPPQPKSQSKSTIMSDKTGPSTVRHSDTNIEKSTVETQAPHSRAPLNVDTVDWSRIVFEKPDTKTVPNKNTQYTIILIKYRYREEGEAQNWYIEFPELESRRGIVQETGDDGKLDSFRISFILRESDLEAQNVANFLSQLDKRMVNEIILMKKAFKGRQCVTSLTKENASLLMRKNLFSPEIEEGSEPATFAIIRLRYFKGKDQKLVKTNFYSPSGKEITDWKLLTSAHIRIIPYIQIREIYISDKIYPQVQIVSAIVTFIEPVEDLNPQRDALQRYGQDQVAIDRVEAGLKAMELASKQGQGRDQQNYAPLSRNGQTARIMPASSRSGVSKCTTVVKSIPVRKSVVKRQPVLQIEYPEDETEPPVGEGDEGSEELEELEEEEELEEQTDPRGTALMQTMATTRNIRVTPKRV